jgi:hypothetical protein
MTIDDETLMAFADGELSSARRKEVEHALTQDESLRQRLDAHLRLKQRLSSAFAGALEEPVPERLRAAARGESRRSDVVQLSERRAQAWSFREWGAMAASVAAGLVLGVGVMNTNAPSIVVTDDGVMARGALARALETQLAADEPGAARIGITFRTEDGRYCRTFSLVESATAGLACRDQDEWSVAMTAAHASGGEVRMAAAPPEILAVVDAMIIGEPLDAAAEARARDAGWNPRSAAQ